MIVRIFECVAEQDDNQLFDHFFLAGIGDLAGDFCFQGTSSFVDRTLKRQYDALDSFA